MTQKRLLTPFERWVIEQKGTERPFTGLYTHTDAPGLYHCKRCDAALYRSEDKFASHCGWPSFDEEIPGAVQRKTDADGQRTEIVFHGEGFTSKNVRHCVNSVSLTFEPRHISGIKSIVLASGCFWGTQYFLARIPGVLETKVGYTGGHTRNPSYKQVCEGTTGHVEAVEVFYDPSQVDLAEILKIYFETHDFSQADGQGPDIGPQYLSVLFFESDEERTLAQSLIDELRTLGHGVATQLKPRAEFWVAEDYHQDYYERKGDTPYCHVYREMFNRKV
jgi:peptide methionine sulfoxide reductase msrA/msrB